MSKKNNEVIEGVAEVVEETTETVTETTEEKAEKTGFLAKAKATAGKVVHSRAAKVAMGATMMIAMFALGRSTNGGGDSGDGGCADDSYGGTADDVAYEDTGCSEE